MKKTIEALKAEIIKEQIALEEEAFEIYCKRELERQINCVMGYKKDWNSSVEKLNSLTIDKLKEDFNSYSPSLLDTPKKRIIEQLKNNT